MTAKYLGRRELLALVALGAQAATGRAAGAPPRLAIADISGSAETLLQGAAQRFALYRRLGFSMLRTSIRWSSFERAPARWEIEPLKLQYLQTAVQSGLSLKLEVGVWASAPAWFMSLHPDAALRNIRGYGPNGVLSPWFPKVAALIAEKQNRMLQMAAENGLLKSTPFVIASLGPAGEAIYPAGWEITDKGPPSFWFFDQHAQADFSRYANAVYKGNLAAANTKWGTTYGSWAQVAVPAPGTIHGPLWQDVLVWYRDAKRSLVMSTLQALQSSLMAVSPGQQKPIIVLVPGSHMTAEKWAAAVASGDGDSSVKVMIDTDFLLDLAYKTGVQLQSTAAQTEADVQYILSGMQSRGFQVPVWAENAGGKPALNPEHLADVILKNNLYGLDYIDGGTLFGPGGTAPTALAPRVKNALATIAARVGR